MPERMCSPVCCCILSKRHSQSMDPAAGGAGHVPPAGRASTVCQMTPLALMDIRNVEHGAVGQGQGAAVGRLAAALRVKHRAVQCHAPAARLCVRLRSKDDARRRSLRNASAS